MTAASRFKGQRIRIGIAIVIVFVVGLVFVCAFLEITKRIPNGIAVEVNVSYSVRSGDTAHVNFVIRNVGDVDIGLSHVMVQIGNYWRRVETIAFLPVRGIIVTSTVTLSPVGPGRYNAKFVLDDDSYAHKFTFVIW